ncbi:MAG: hypothetical protein CW346_17790 [Bacillaceae bacterium]|nr:hypothetical protein [Bacillaceae bacterium]
MRNNIRPIMPKTCPGHPIGPSHEEGFGGSGPDKRTRRPSREIPRWSKWDGKGWEQGNHSNPGIASPEKWKIRNLPNDIDAEGKKE